MATVMPSEASSFIIKWGVMAAMLRHFGWLNCTLLSFISFDSDSFYCIKSTLSFHSAPFLLIVTHVLLRIKCAVHKPVDQSTSAEMFFLKHLSASTIRPRRRNYEIASYSLGWPFPEALIDLLSYSILVLTKMPVESLMELLVLSCPAQLPLLNPCVPLLKQGDH